MQTRTSEMSDRPTPETDAVADSNLEFDEELAVVTTLARRLERERDEAQDALRDELERPSRDVECEALRIERDELRAEVERLRGRKCEWAGSVSRCTLAGKEGA
jgi:hypothetical protein